MDTSIQELENGIQLLTLNTAIEMYTAHKLRSLFDELHSQNKHKFIVDLQNVKNIDSSGLAIFIREVNYLKQLQLPLVLLNVNKRVYDILHWTVMFNSVKICDSIEEAQEIFT